VKSAARAVIAATLASVAIVTSFAAPARAVTYSTSGAPEQVSLGDTIGSQYDQLIINPYVGNLTTGTIILNPLVFIAGVNATVPQFYNNLSSISETITVGTSTQSLTIPFNLNISYSDTLTVIGGATLTFLDAGTLWQIVVNGLTIGPNSGGPMYANLTAQVTDPPVSQTPLPAALPLFASGLGAMGLFGWWRKRKKAAAGA